MDLAHPSHDDELAAPITLISDYKEIRERKLLLYNQLLGFIFFFLQGLGSHFSDKQPLRCFGQ